MSQAKELSNSYCFVFVGDAYVNLIPNLGENGRLITV